MSDRGVRSERNISKVYQKNMRKLSKHQVKLMISATLILLPSTLGLVFADTYVTTEGNTIVITNQPSTKQRAKAKVINRKKRKKTRSEYRGTCYLENRKNGEKVLKTNPRKTLFNTHRVIWCEEESESAVVVAQAEEQVGFKKKAKPSTRNKNGGRSLPRRAEQFKDFVSGAAKKYQLPEALLWAFMKVESDFIPTAVSRKGAQGLMQLMPLTAKDMGVTDPFDPQQNIYGASKLLSILMKRFNSELPLVISAYHAGGGAVTKKEGIPYSETSRYMTSVLNAYYRFMKKPPYVK